MTPPDPISRRTTLLADPEPTAEPGRPVAFAPFYRSQLRDPLAVERATIPVEKIRGPVQLVSGMDGQMWPSSDLADIAFRRLEAHHHPFPSPADRQPSPWERLFMPHSGPSGSPTWRLSWVGNWPWEYTKAQGLRCARMSRSNRSRSSIWTYERHSNIDARVCWGHLMLVTPDRGLGSKCDYQRDALATGIVRGRYDGGLSEIYESL